jgi:Fe2+ or Zn2+ uptake regulation protein
MDDSLREEFHAVGRRLTSQRRLILDVLIETPGHLDAEDIHDRVKVRDPDLSLATVYRTLGVLKEMGLVEEYSLGEGHSHYEAMREEPHYHFVCLRCGQVIEFSAPAVVRIKEQVVEEQGVRITEVHLRLGGYCARCKGRARQCETGAESNGKS